MRVTVGQLTAFTVSCLQAAGVPLEEANLIADTMVAADAKGIHSHGVMRLPIYVQRMQQGWVRPAAQLTVTRDDKAVAVMNAHSSAGQVAASQAMELATAKAATFGTGVVSVTGSNHFGIASYYALQAAARQMIGIVMSNTTPLMPPIGGAEKVLGNNPLAIAAPSNTKHPIVLDMAMSQVALGKILYARSQDAQIPEGWGADKQGRATRNPQEVLDGGFILPTGGPKGFGLALMIELLTGVLGGGQQAKEIPSLYDLSQRQEISHFMLAIDISAFMSVAHFTARAGTLAAYVKQAVKAEGVTTLYMPGEREFMQEEMYRRDGIPLNGDVVSELDALAQRVQLQPLTEEWDNRDEQDQNWTNRHRT